VTVLVNTNALSQLEVGQILLADSSGSPVLAANSGTQDEPGIAPL